VNTDTFDNLTPWKCTVLQNLRINEDIIIKPADKGSLLGTKVFLDPKASSEIIKFLRQFGLVDGTRNWAEIKTL
jgi:hypothetical protein